MKAQPIMTKPDNNLTLSILKETLAICKFDSQADIPHWLSIVNCKFLSITKTAEELSIVCEQTIIPKQLASTVSVVKDWYALKIEGPLDFSLTGILSTLLQPLAEEKISIFALSTYDTDYILVKEKNLKQAVEILQRQCVVI